MQSVALIDIYYGNTMQMLRTMPKVIHYQYAFPLVEEHKHVFDVCVSLCSCRHSKPVGTVLTPPNELAFHFLIYSQRFCFFLKC